MLHFTRHRNGRIFNMGLSRERCLPVCHPIDTRATACASCCPQDFRRTLQATTVAAAGSCIGASFTVTAAGCSVNCASAASQVTAAPLHRTVVVMLH